MKSDPLKLIIVSIGSNISDSKRDAMNGMNLIFRVTELDTVKLRINGDNEQDFINSQTKVY